MSKSIIRQIANARFEKIECNEKLTIVYLGVNEGFRLLEEMSRVLNSDKRNEITRIIFENDIESMKKHVNSMTVYGIPVKVVDVLVI